MGNSTAQNKNEKKIKLSSGAAVPQEQVGGCC